MEQLGATRQLVMQARLEQAYEVLSLHFTDESSDFALDKEAIHELQREYYMRVITDEHYRIERSKLVMRLLEFINEAEAQADEEVLAQMEAQAERALQLGEDGPIRYVQYMWFFDWFEKVVIILTVISVALSVVYGGEWMKASLVLLLILYFLVR